MKIGIFSGSFNPIHIGHLILGNYVVEYTDIEQVWFLVTPHNPLKEENSLIDETERLKMVQLATEAYPKLQASDFEFSLSRPSFTVDTLAALGNKYPEHEFTLIIGGDNWDSINRWKDHEKIIKNHKVLIYPRLDNRLIIPSQIKNTVEAIDAPIVDISSTMIREGFEEEKNMRPFLSSEVYDYIVSNKLYSVNKLTSESVDK